MTNVNVIEILDFKRPFVTELLVAFLAVKVQKPDLMVWEKLPDQKIRNESCSWSVLLGIFLQKTPVNIINILIRVHVGQTGFHATFIVDAKPTIEKLLFRLQFLQPKIFVELQVLSVVAGPMHDVLSAF